MEYEGNRPIRVLLPHQLETYSLTGNGDFPRISEAEIADKSKGDAISKGVVILQTGWFVTQCIARGVQGLPITELELVTVAFSSLNFVIYLLWWDKPQSVQRGVRVYKKRRTEKPMNDGDVEATIGFWVALRDAISDVSATIVRKVREAVRRVREAIRTLYEQLCELVPPTATLPPVEIVRAPIRAARILVPSVSIFPAMCRAAATIRGPSLMSGPLRFLRDSMFGGDGVDEVELKKRVDTFYPAQWVSGSEKVSIFLVATVAFAFGAIHCIGWTFTFPSDTERALWRVAASLIMGVPIAIFPLGELAKEAGKLYGADDFWVGFIYVSLSSLYLYSRFALLVLPILSLRLLPPAAFYVVDWTSSSFILHV